MCCFVYVCFVYVLSFFNHLVQDFSMYAGPGAPSSSSAMEWNDRSCGMPGLDAEAKDDDQFVKGVLGPPKLYSLRGVAAKLVSVETDGDGAAQFLGVVAPSRCTVVRCLFSKSARASSLPQTGQSNFTPLWNDSTCRVRSFGHQNLRSHPGTSQPSGRALSGKCTRSCLRRSPRVLKVFPRAR